MTCISSQVWLSPYPISAPPLLTTGCSLRGMRHFFPLGNESPAYALLLTQNSPKGMEWLRERSLGMEGMNSVLSLDHTHIIVRCAVLSSISQAVLFGFFFHWNLDDTHLAMLTSCICITQNWWCFFTSLYELRCSRASHGTCVCKNGGRFDMICTWHESAYLHSDVSSDHREAATWCALNFKSLYILRSKLLML